MKFRKLTIDNYKSFQFTTEIYFPDSNNGKSIFLIGGMNGAGKTSIMESINFCLYGGKKDDIYRAINRKELAEGNSTVSFELIAEFDDGSELLVNRSWNAGVISTPKAKDLHERLVVIKDGKQISSQNQQMWQDFIRAKIPQGITQFFFFDGEKIQEIAADDHSEVRLKSSLEAALGIQNINRLATDLNHLKQDERKVFVEISDEDLSFKESELKKEQAKLNRFNRDRSEIKDDLNNFKEQYADTKARFQATFSREPENKESIRQADKHRIQTANRLGQLEHEIHALCDITLPFSILGGLFANIRNQIEIERESLQEEAIKEHASELSKKIVRVVEEPEPIYNEHLSAEKMQELELRIFKLLSEGDSKAVANKVLNLSDRDAARIFQKFDELEDSDVFLIKPHIEEKQELEIELKNIESSLNSGLATDSEQELLRQFQEEMESCSTQIGRKTEQLRVIEESILTLGRKIKDVNVEIEKLYEKHNQSKGKADFINECDAIANLLNLFIVSMRKNKVHLLQEKTYEMYKMLSAKSGLIKDIMIDEKSFEVKISDRNGHEIKKSGLSAGEKEVFALSLLWGLSQTSQLNLPIIIDTPLSRLDSTHRDKIIRNYFPNAGEQVIILSTDTEIDNDYYKALEGHLIGAVRLVFDQQKEFTTIISGYFWEDK